MGQVAGFTGLEERVFERAREFAGEYARASAVRTPAERRIDVLGDGIALATAIRSLPRGSVSDEERELWANLSQLAARIIRLDEADQIIRLDELEVATTAGASSPGHSARP
jgi:hypothetical protein